MSDIQDLLGGTESAKLGTDQSSAADQKDRAKKRRPTPKPAWVIQREKATGIDAQWSDEANAGRGGYVFPGLSPKMGGPSAKNAPYGQGEVNTMKNAPATLEGAKQDFFRGGYQDAYDKLLQMEKADPKVKQDPEYKKIRKHVEIELNIS